jgi:ABC-type transport system involved in multi-copper enzyme maturation permease subunit
VIGLGTATGVWTRLSWMRLRRGRLVWVGALLWALPLLYVGGLAAAGQWGRGLFDSVLELYASFLWPFVPALALSGAVADEIEQKTFTFAFARPAPRAALVLGKWAAATLPSLALVVPSLALAWVVAHLRDPGDMADTWPHLLAVEAAAITAISAYGALAMLLGTLLSRHPVVAVLGYLLIVEIGLAATGTVTHLLAISWHARNLAELPRATTEILESELPRWVSALFVFGLTPALLAVTSLVVEHAEYRTDR